MTADEARTLFVEYVSSEVDYWLNVSKHPALETKLEGLAESILGALDGRARGLPSFVILPVCSPEGRRERIQGDIAGSIREDFLARRQACRGRSMYGDD